MLRRAGQRLEFSLRLTVVPVVAHQDLQYHLVQPVAEVGKPAP
jgi:hypothetical protein